MLKPIDEIVRNSLTDFVEDIFGSNWKGREREAVSLYAFGYLQRHVHGNSILRDATQIGIEVAVPSWKEDNKKRQVNKDLIIWTEPKQTCWDSQWNLSNYPLVVMEWKVFHRGKTRPSMCIRDVDWLQKYSERHQGLFVGYAVSLDLRERHFRLCVARAERGRVSNEWLLLPVARPSPSPKGHSRRRL